MSSVIEGEIANYLAYQNQNRGLSGEEVQKDYYDNLVPIGGNAVWGTAGITAGAAPIDLSLGSAYSAYNTMIFDGDHSTSASTSGTDNYAFSVNAAGTVTMLDENTGQTEQLTHVSYLIFDGGHRTSDGTGYQSIYYVEGSSGAQIASLYNAALGRQPDLPGLEYYQVRLGNGEMTLHQEASAFLASPEFLAKYPGAAAPADNGGTNDQAFITQLYQNILHRTPSASDLAYYVADLQGTQPGVPQQDRAQLLINFSVSPENQTDISGWLINTANGGYTDSGVPVASSEAVSLVGVSAAHHG